MEKKKGTAYSKKASVKGYGEGKEAAYSKKASMKGYGEGKGSCILKESQCERVWRRKREQYTQRKPV